jgi:hypothetical protein
LPITGKAIFLLKIKPNMLLIWWTLVQKPKSKCVYSKYMLWHFAYSYGVRHAVYTYRRWLFYSDYIHIFSFLTTVLLWYPNFFVLRTLFERIDTCRLYLIIGLSQPKSHRL